MRIFTAAILLVFATHTQAQQPPAATPTPAAQNCNFTYKPESVKIIWTGYKLTEKKGVKGEFKEFKVMATPLAKTPEELILSTSIDVDTAKFDSGDPGRDSNLSNFFFKKIKGPHILGKVESFNPAILKIKTQMNGLSKILAFRVSVDGTKYLAETDFDMIDTFKMKNPHDSLSKACASQHKGADGKSKTWTQVSLSLSAEIVNSCADQKGAVGGH